MANKILIAPVGIYQQRVWKSIVRSGSDKIYLISDSKPEYESTKVAAEELEKQIINLGSKVIKEEADFSNQEDIYRVFMGIIAKEKAENPYVEIQIDLSSTTKLAWHIASNLAIPYGITLTYVPGIKKPSAETIKKRYETQKDDIGGDVQKIIPAFSKYEGEPLSKDEIRVLYKMEDKRYGSVNQLIKELANDEGKELNDAYEKKFLRIVRELEEKKLVIGVQRGKAKIIELTTIGKGIVKGLKEADKRLREEKLKPLLELLYV